MNPRLAEFIVVAIVLVWLGTVVAAVIDPNRAAAAGQLAPVVGTIAGGAVAVLTISRRKNGGGNGR